MTTPIKKKPFSRLGKGIKKVITAPIRFVRKGLEKDRAYTKFKDQTYRREYGDGQL